MSRSILLFALASTVTTLAACGDDTGAGGSGGGGTGGSGGAGVTPVCTDPVAVPCEDEVVLQMNLQADVAPGLVTANEADGSGWHTTVDATAGGAMVANPDSYVYARFTDTGLEKVEISDEQSLASMDWDIAFRRYVIRINSGHSGPSCVTAARLAGTPVYDDVTTEPDGLVFRADEYFTDTCELIADGTGLPGSPATALASFWTYPGCVAMTGNVFIVELANGRHLKLTVTSYYSDDAQAQCNTEGTVPMTGSGSGNVQLRWAFL